MILRPGPRESCLERFSLKSFLLFLMLTSTGVFVTSVWRLHVTTKGGSYRIAQIAEISPDVNDGSVAGGDLAGLKKDLMDMIRTENKHMLQEILERIQYLSNGKADSVLVQGVRNTDRLIKQHVAPADSLWAAVVKSHQNLTKDYWSRDWRSTVPLEGDAKKYLEEFETKCESHDSGEKVIDRTGLENTTNQLPLCPCVPATLVGRIVPNTKVLLNLTWDVTDPLAHTLVIGGYWKPQDCLARRRVAVIIPCRDREPQLRAFLVHMHPLLQRHLVEYRVFVVEQEWPQIYNKASSMNAGFLEALKMMNFDCVMFHDVDLLAEDDRSVVYCGDQPRHYGAYLDKWSYNIGYARIFGGAVVLTKEQFVKANGFSNIYFGWGGEDDDFEKRVRNAGYEIERPPKDVSRHSSLTHKRDRANPVNPGSSRAWHNTPSEYAKEGLNTVAYRVRDVILEPLFTWIKVNLKLGSTSPILEQKPFQYFKVFGACVEDDNHTVTVIRDESLSEVTCRYECDIEPNCRSYIYYRLRDNHCVHLSAICQIDHHVSDAIVHIKTGNVTESNYSMQIGDCKGHDIEGLKLSLKECIQACNARKDCVGFAYAELIHSPCWLKNDTCSVTQESVLGIKYYTKLKRDST